MEIILLKDIKGLGKKDAIVQVKPGYARNYLVPKSLAINASDSNRKILKENLKQRQEKSTKIKTKAEEKAKEIASRTFNISVRSSAQGKIFGSITALQIVDALKKYKISIEREQIIMPPEMKSVGEYTLKIKLHPEITQSLQINIISSDVKK